MSLEDKGIEVAKLKAQARLANLAQPKPARPTIHSYDTSTGTYTVKEGANLISGCRPITNGTLPLGAPVVLKGRLIDQQRHTPTPPKPSTLQKRPPKGAILFFDSNIWTGSNSPWIRSLFKVFMDKNYLYILPEADSRLYQPAIRRVYDLVGDTTYDIRESAPEEDLDSLYILPEFNPGTKLTDSEKNALNAIAKQQAVILISEWKNPAVADADWLSVGAEHWALCGHDCTTFERINSGQPDESDAVKLTEIDPRFAEEDLGYRSNSTASYRGFPDNIIPLVWAGSPAPTDSYASVVYIPSDAIGSPIESKEAYGYTGNV